MLAITIRLGAARLRERMKQATWIFLLLAFSLIATSHAQDINSEVDAFDRQISARRIDLGVLDLTTIVGKGGTTGIAVQNASPSPTTSGLTRYRWTQSATNAGREELLKSTGAPAMEPYIRTAYTKPEFDRLDSFSLNTAAPITIFRTR
jgi:hypothetical protein